MSDARVHLMKQTDGRDTTTKCGVQRPSRSVASTAWWREVTCPKCLRLMAQPIPQPQPVPRRTPR